MVMWLRSPLWDSFWILSGLPLGLVLVLISALAHIPAATITIYLIVVCQTAHSVSPIALAWSHSGFRQIMLRKKSKYVLLPGAVLGIATVSGFLSSDLFAEAQFTDANSSLVLSSLFRAGIWRNPGEWLIVTYMTWNLYHFGMQNFGVLQLYRRTSSTAYGEEQRQIDMAFCLAVQIAVTSAIFMNMTDPVMASYIRLLYLLIIVAGIVMLVREGAITRKHMSPRVLFIMSHTMSVMFGQGLWVTAINGLNHWLTAIGLSSHVYSRHTNRSPLLFAGVVILFGITLFWALFWKVGGRLSWNLREMMQLTMTALGFRLGIGMVHFCYDRWLWKLSDLQVRATIGRDLL
jgi:hypothetical protein